jgi:uncharacterized protein (DUF885 family)
MLGLGVMLAGLTQQAGSMSNSGDETTSGAAQSLHALFAAEWDYEMQRHPVRASSLGDRRWNDRWPDVSLEAIQKDHEHRIAVLARLKALDRRLAARDQLNYDIFKQEYESDVEGYDFHWFLIPLDQREGIQTSDTLADELRFETLKDYQDWLARLRAFPVYMDQTIALMAEGIRERMMLPRVVMQRLPAQASKQIVADPEASPYYRPFNRFAPGIGEADRARLAAEAKDAIASDVVPAFKRFQRFFTEQYLPASFDEAGVWQNPRGAEMYAYFVRRHTTTNLTPAEIHALGLREVGRIRAEMDGVMRQTGFEGTRAEFFKFLRTDPRFHYNTAEELLTAYRAIAKRIDPNLIKVFRVLPRLPYGVEPIPATVAPDTTAAYYRPPAADGSRAGTYMVNLYKPETRFTWEMMALSLHEAVPGHHVQIALSMEQQGLPNFRRYGYYDAFGEGWALYAESLGEDMGLYDDPYAKFGELTYDMWRAVRLVIDTGIHAMRWDRQKAIDYFMDNAPRGELDITNEVDRYIVWPGQALAYKIGQLKIRELRERASRELGPRFDLREFHEVALRNGAVPLGVLEKLVDDWIREKKEGR